MTTSKLTITEALQEIKTIDARLEKKKNFVFNFLWRISAIRDPHEKDGGSAQLVAQERQAHADLLERKIKLRMAINLANDANTITIGKFTRTIAEWLVWKRDVAPIQKAFLQDMYMKLQAMRNENQRKGVTVVDKVPAEVTNDIVVNINESELARQIEGLEEVLGTLDGQFSLKNATVKIEV